MEDNRMRFMMQAGVAGALILGATAFASSAVLADTIKYKVTMNGASETPPNDSKGTGTGDISYDTATKTLTWTFTYDGLTGPAKAAHFHGPAGTGEKAPPVVPLSGDLASPIKGSAVLNEKQDQVITSGKWYFNIHTAKFPDGELRGEAEKVQ
jgi:hypothetical protein